MGTLLQFLLILHPSDASQFNSIASSIVQQHLPSSILPSLAIAIQTAIASATPNGTADINSLVRSAIYAPTPPPFLASGLPPDLQSKVNDMEDSISALRVQVSGFTTMSSKGVVGTVTIPVEQTQTARNGSVVVTRVPALLVNDTSTPTSSEMVSFATLLSAVLLL